MSDHDKKTAHAPVVSDMMTPEPDVIHVDHPLVEAAARMRDLDVGLMFVVDGDQLVGALTDRDVCCRAVAAGIDPARSTVLRVMTRHVVFCRSDDGLDTVLQTMERENVRRLAVLNDEDELVGVVSLTDLARVHPQPAKATRLLERIATPTGPAKRPRRGFPTGGRAVSSRSGVPGTYAQRPRLPSKAGVGTFVANGE